MTTYEKNALMKICDKREIEMIEKMKTFEDGTWAKDEALSFKDSLALGVFKRFDE
jgi:hypothetical protein